MKNDLFTINFDTNPSPWFTSYVEIAFSKKKLQPVIDDLVKGCSNKNYSASYNYDSIVNKVLEKHWDNSCGSIRPYLKAVHKMLLDQKPENANWHNGNVAAARSIDSKMAWMTPGFIEAKRYNDVYGG